MRCQLKFGILAILFGFAPALIHAQKTHSEWAWMGAGAAEYGTKYGFADYQFPVARAMAVHWTDREGRVWIFSGVGGGGYINDLWAFDPSLGSHGQWAWMGGTDPLLVCDPYKGCQAIPSVYGKEYEFAASNIPAGRAGAVASTAPDGRVWLFGGEWEEPGIWGVKNDLWVFDSAQGSHGEWAWMGGSSTPASYGTEYQFAPSNVPGPRYGAVSWTDRNGRFWLFGGFGVDAGGNECILNDLWVFDPAHGKHGEWAWMGGSEIVRSPGVNGTEYQFGPNNVPGSRGNATVWSEPSGKVWLFGGQGYDSVDKEGYFNDLWVFDPALGGHGEWAWMGGSNTVPTSCAAGYAWCGLSGVYGARYEFGASNNPGGRISGVSWTDAEGNLWLFSGQGYDSIGHYGDMNDLWEFSPSTGSDGQWRWVDGYNRMPTNCTSEAGLFDPACIAAPTYGVEYHLNAENTPEGQEAGVTWTDKTGSRWLLSGYFPTLWMNSMVTTQTIDFPQPDTPVILGAKAVRLSATATSHLAVSFSVISGPGKVSGTDGSTLTFLGEGAVVVAANQAGNSDFASAPQVTRRILVNPAGVVATPVIAPKTGTYSSSQKVTIIDTTAGAGIYYTTDGSTPSATHGTRYRAPFAVSHSETIKAAGVKTDYTTSAVATAKYTVKK